MYSLFFINLNTSVTICVLLVIYFSSFTVKASEQYKRDIARMILSYLRKNPDAGDTLEGIG